MQQQESQEIPQATTAVIVECVNCECMQGRGRLHDAVVSQTARPGAMIASCGASRINDISSISLTSLIRLWAATGQAALEESRILVISGTATSTSILKNLVLPGIGHFTILDDARVSPEDAGNNFFLEAQDSIGKLRAEEEVRLLRELNDSVDGQANTNPLEELLDKDPGYLTSFSIVIAHNLSGRLLTRLADLLWEADSSPTLAVVRSAGFVAEFFLQYHNHAGVWREVCRSTRANGRLSD